MTCLSDEVVAAWAAGNLSEREREDYEGHAAECAACRAITVAMMGVAPRGASIAFGADDAFVGRYRIAGPAGAGAMGVVLRGRDTLLDRDVAIKLINSATATDEQRERMLREARALAKIDHPNVVRVHDAGVVADEVFVAMELVAGDTLAKWLDGAPPAAARIGVLAGVGEGLAAVHAAGLVHRDVKPENILVRGGTTGVLVDFGLARAAQLHGPTGSGVAGTPRYLAPEVAGGAAASEQADQFAWWTVVDETLRDAALSRRQRAAADAAIARGRSRHPMARFPAMRDAVAALRAVVAPGRSRRAWLLAAAAVAMTGIAVAIGFARRPATRDACELLPAGWEPPRRSAIAARLPTAGADAPRVTAAIDQRAERTAILRERACRTARDATGEDRTRAVRQLLCIDETWQQTQRLFAGLADPDPIAVRAAVDELIGVLPVERCAAGAIPAVPEPPTASQKVEAYALEAALREIRLDPAAAPGPRLARLRALEPRIRALAYVPLTGVWHADVAGALAAGGDLAAARSELETSARLAETAGDDDVRVRALINMLRNELIAGTERDTKAIEATADAVAQRLGNPLITSELRSTQAQLRFAHGESAAALVAMRESARLLDSIAIDAHAQLVNNAQNLAALEQATGDLRAAQATFDRGYAIARKRYGDNHFDTLIIRGARATNYLYANDFAAARSELEAVEAGLAGTLGDAHPQVAQVRAYLCELAIEQRPTEPAVCEAALRTAEAAFGRDHAQLVWSLSLVGRQRIKADHAADAIEPLERALAIASRGTVSPMEGPTAKAYLALALHHAGKQPERAKTLAREGAAALRGQPTMAEVVAELDAAFP